LGTLFLLLLTCGICSADTIIVTGVDWSRGESLWMNGDGSDFQAYFAGVIEISVTDPSGTFARDSLCVDLFTDIYIDQPYYTVLRTPADFPEKNLARVSWLVDNALLPTQSSFTSLLPQSDWVTSVAQGAGIQLAIWDIVHDNGDGFSAGRVRAATGQNGTDPAVLAWANLYESVSLGQSSNLAYVYQNVDMGNGQPAQMLAGPMFKDGGPTPQPLDPLTPADSAPEPGTLLLTAAALASIAAWRRRIWAGLF
jgi:hypothetical protein